MPCMILVNRSWSLNLNGLQTSQYRRERDDGQSPIDDGQSLGNLDPFPLIGGKRQRLITSRNSPFSQSKDRCGYTKYFWVIHGLPKEKEHSGQKLWCGTLRNITNLLNCYHLDWVNLQTCNTPFLNMRNQMVVFSAWCFVQDHPFKHVYATGCQRCQLVTT